MKLRCLLVDDEPPALKILASYVEGMDNLELAGQCYNAFEAMQVLQRTTVDIIFLDINMPRLLGTEFIRTLRHPPKVIFTPAIHTDERPSVAPETKSVPPPDDTFLYFRSDRKMIKVMLDEIVYIESLKDYIRIVRTGHPPLIVKQSISIAEEMLPDTLFLRIQRSFIVSLKKVTAYTQSDVEIDGIEIPIGKLYKDRIGRLAGRPGG
jgi:DNA-binding LytR/AlgR family response regulator